jgi:hypothetical protein
VPPLSEPPELVVPPLPEPPDPVLPPLPAPPDPVLPPLPEPPELVVPPLPEPPALVVPPLPEPPELIVPPLPEPPELVVPPLPSLPPLPEFMELLLLHATTAKARYAGSPTSAKQCHARPKHRFLSIMAAILQGAALGRVIDATASAYTSPEKSSYDRDHGSAMVCVLEA